MTRAALLLAAAVAAAAPVAHPPRLATLPAGSPDGRSIVCCVQQDSAQSDLAIVDIATGLMRRLTYSRDDEQVPGWTAGGRRIVCTIARGDSEELRTIALDGSDTRTLFVRAAKSMRLSNAGTRVAYVVGTWTRGRVRVENTDGTQAHAISDSTAGWWNLAWSPDDKRIAATRRDSTGGLQLWLLDPAGSRPRELVRLPESAGRPQWPAWSPNGRAIAFQAGTYVRDDPVKSDAYVHVVDIASGAIRKLRRHPRPWLDETPSWLDDRHIAFQSTQTGAFQVWVMNADGSGARQITQ